ncbi:MAG: DUF87 domain-containing protein, partial [Candidatus Woesearchaeota archaeon]|nr:DUF87 domain-containing protein [Candidatus Woesearchaeota archaeon]
VGRVISDDAKGGVITSLDIRHRRPADNWWGVAGITLSAAALNTSWYIFSDSNSAYRITELNPIFSCLAPGQAHEIYATTLTAAQMDWASVTAGTTQMLDDYIGLDYNDTQSATNSFTSTINVELGNTLISNVPAIYMQQYNTLGSTAFPVGILQQSGTIIMVALVNDNFLTGFRPDKIFNYEMMVPVPPGTNTMKYYLYADPYDECPEGAGELSLPGNIHGWVTDNSTGAFLENALVSVSNKIYITGADGFYNMTGIPADEYYVISIKTGFGNYVNNVTIEANESTEHNISMSLVYDESLTGTGPGIGTGVGPGEDSLGTKTKSDVGPGPGIGPGIGPFIERPEDIGKPFFMSLNALKKRLRLENFFTEHLLIFSFAKEPVTANVRIVGDAAEIVDLSTTEVTIEPNQYANITVRGYGTKYGVFNGKIEVTGDINDSLPVEITVSDEERLPVEALLINLQALTRRPLPGNRFKFSVNLQNLLIDEAYDVRLDYYIRGVDAETANNSMYIGNDTVAIRTSQTLIKDTVIPGEWTKGDYFLIVEARYFDQESRTSTIVEVFEPIQNYKVFGLVELWKMLIGLLILTTIIGIIIYIRHEINKKKRYHVKLEYSLLPKKGPRSLYVGKIAETENDTYFDMDKLTVHSIIAGSTGGGKSISAQVVIEEALLKNVAVIVFDPTAQWTGMLRKCADEKMFQFYPRFHMTKKDAKAFSGNIRAIKNPKEKIDLMKYWKPGEIQVITTSTLDPRGMDIFVANTVRTVFKSNLQEYRGLRYMMVYDEVHRLLPKFGGSGEGFVQIERACREFRKWGIGVMLISQVLADFVGQIKANINTEIQMKTRDEGDLQRIETKYGKSYVQELVKSPVGSGMVQNSDWNRGQPYYVQFRPIIHSVIRLSDAELDQYNKYNGIVEDLSYQLDQLEEIGKDVFDMRLELKLSVDKIKQGGFNMVEIYLEGLKPRIDKLWKELGKTPKVKELELVSDSELNAAVEEAKKESEKAKAKEVVAGEAAVKALGINDDVPGDKMLTLCNGTLVIKLKALLDEVNVLKDEDFVKHVNAEKNDFSVWIRDAYKNDKWADISDQILAKADYVKFLELLYEGKEKDFKVTVKREKPFTTKKQEVKPPEAKPEDAKQAEAKPADVKAVDIKTAEAKPAETKPADVKPVETKTVEAKTVDAKPIGTKQEAKPEEKKEDVKTESVKAEASVSKDERQEANQKKEESVIVAK